MVLCSSCAYLQKHKPDRKIICNDWIESKIRKNYFYEKDKREKRTKKSQDKKKLNKLGYYQTETGSWRSLSASGGIPLFRKKKTVA